MIVCEPWCDFKDFFSSFSAIHNPRKSYSAGNFKILHQTEGGNLDEQEI